MRTDSSVLKAMGLVAGAWLLLVVAAPGGAAQAQQQLPTQVQPKPQPVASASGTSARLDDRIKLLAAELGLNDSQQQGVRRILENQRAQVMKIWSDTSVPAAYRVHATRTLSDQSVEQIRALLTDEQKLKYNEARKPREDQTKDSGPSVEDWMKATNGR
jgi:protein CpxP